MEAGGRTAEDGDERRHPSRGPPRPRESTGSGAAGVVELKLGLNDPTWEGMGPVKKTARVLREALFDGELERPIKQIVIICGRNQVLVGTLRSMEWKVSVKVRGFETQMEQWMAACDCKIP